MADHPNVRDGLMGERSLPARIRGELARHGDPARAASQQAYMKSAMPYHGLTSAELKAVLRPILDDPTHRSIDRAEWEAVIRDLWDHATHREQRYAALAIIHHRWSRPFREQGAIELYRYLIGSGAWWDLVDDIATHLVRERLLADPVATAPELRRWARDDDLWVRRAAIISQIGAKARTDRMLLADVIEPNLEGGHGADRNGRQDFFIRKGIGWVLREYAKTEPAWVVGFVDDHRDRMAGLTIREALKHQP